MKPIQSALSCFAAITAAATLGALPAFAGGGKEIADGKACTAVCEESCFSYDFADIQYIYSSFNSLEDGHGAGINFSKELGGNVYLTGSGSWTESGGADLYGASAGAGYYIPVNSRLHLNIEAGGLYSNDNDLGEGEEWGFYAGPGLRYCLNQGLEIFANAYYTRFESGFDQWEFNVGLIADITDTVAFKLGGLLNEDDQAVMAGLRFYF